MSEDHPSLPMARYTIKAWPGVREEYEYSAYADDSGDWVRYEAAAQQLRALEAERIEPLVKSDDPEIAEAVRVTADYVLMTREAADAEAAMHHRWRDERDALKADRAALHARLKELEAALEKLIDASSEYHIHSEVMLIGDTGYTVRFLEARNEAREVLRSTQRETDPPDTSGEQDDRERWPNGRS